MEKFIFVRNRLTLSNLDKSFSGIYFGNEFCQYHIPEIDEVIEFYKLSQKLDMKFTFVTPLVSDYGINKLKEIFEELKEVTPNIELVFNDFGVYRLARNYKFKSLILGRLLNRQKRDTKILHLIERKDKLLKDLINYFRKSIANIPNSYEFFKSLGIERIELDNLLHKLSDEKLKIKCSLYYPWNYISMSRWCHRGLTNPPCNYECCNSKVKLEDKPVMPVEIYHIGNVIFFKNEKIPNINYIDRLVYLPEPIV